HAHSYIVDYDDEEIKALFTDVEWEELMKDRIGIPSISLDIAKELAKYDKNTLEDLCATVMTSYLKDGEKYDAHKHHDQEWIQLAILLEFGAIETARSFKGVSDQKYLLENFKMPKTLRDMYSELIKAVNFNDQKAEKIQVFSIVHLGLWIQFTRLWCAGGSICIFRKDFPSHNVDSTFSEDGIRSFLKLLVLIYQRK
ncbi:8841_t:CDS:2, partial [Paraglomus brasilianum]